MARMSALRLSRRAVLASLAGMLAVIAALALALGAPGRISSQYHRIVSDAPVDVGTNFRTRLTEPGSNGRFHYWGIAADQFRAAPFEGEGAGTFQLAVERRRDTPDPVVNAHGLYQETLGELGIVGLLLLVVALSAILFGLGRRMRGTSRAVYAAFFAAALAWTFRAGVDWDWEMPVVTLWLFAAGGAALAAHGPPWSRLRTPRLAVRLAVALPIILLAVVPYKIFGSQAWLDRADGAFAERDCAAATRDATSSLSALGARAEPYELLGYCAIRRGRPQGAIHDMREAIDRDPHNWNFHFGLALARGSAGLDPRPQFRVAHDLNPLDVLTEYAMARFDTDRPGLWKRRANELAQRFTSL